MCKINLAAYSVSLKPIKFRKYSAVVTIFKNVVATRPEITPTAQVFDFKSNNPPEVSLTISILVIPNSFYSEAICLLYCSTNDPC